jgi:hypothetical protein
MSRNLAGPVRGSIEEMAQHDQRVLVGFRLAHPTDRPLDEGIAYDCWPVSREIEDGSPGRAKRRASQIPTATC